MNNIPHQLPPTYQYIREGKRIYVSWLQDGLRYTLPGYWLKDEKAAQAAWTHYNTHKTTHSPQR